MLQWLGTILTNSGLTHIWLCVLSKIIVYVSLTANKKGPSSSYWRKKSEIKINVHMVF